MFYIYIKKHHERSWEPELENFIQKDYEYEFKQIETDRHEKSTKLIIIVTRQKKDIDYIRKNQLKYMCLYQNVLFVVKFKITTI